ncbi:MAG: carboxypeptidase-like regulatory domain-containing protein [Gemmatimonadaceae bacterium]
MSASLAVGSVTAAAQSTPPSTTVRVHVTDSSRTPVVGAEVSIVRGLTTVLARGITDDRGNQSLTVPRSGADAHLVVRKIGYTRVDRFFSDSSVAAIDVRLNRAVRELETVKVTAEEDLRRKSYFIDAEAIEKSERPIVDALDVVLKLRPDMIYGRRGSPDLIGQHVDMRGVYIPHQTAASTRNLATASSAFKAQQYGYCGGLSNVWVNGERVHFVAGNATAEARLVGSATAMQTGIATVLASIKPEHIAEMQYHSCEEVIADAPPGSTNALFVTLKPGIKFAPGVGSFLAASSPRVVAANDVPARGPRIIGVFDDSTGDVVADAEVVDVVSGTFMKTSTTGTATLGFLSPGATEVRVQKPGYESQTLAIAGDTAAITVVLAHLKSSVRFPRRHTNGREH